MIRKVESRRIVRSRVRAARSSASSTLVPCPLGFLVAGLGLLALGLVLPAQSLAASRPRAAGPALHPTVLEPDAAARPLTFEQRLEAQRAIERVYWNRRVWPSENPTPKPSFESSVPDAVLREKVEDTLRKSNALSLEWGRPVTAGQLQAEIDRLARDSREPGILRELYAALGDDPVLVAECLARPMLVDRLARNWYAWDRREHGALKSAAAAILASAATIDDVALRGGSYAERTWVRRQDGSAASSAIDPSETNAIELDAGEWGALIARLRRRIVGTASGTTPPGPVFAPDPHHGPSGPGGTDGSIDPADHSPLPLGLLGPLQEDAEVFTVAAILDQKDDRVKIGTVSWPKTSFDVWWRGRRAAIPTALPAPTSGFRLIRPRGESCEGNTWSTAKFTPAERRGHTAVWTGTEMIVWGGFDGVINVNSGGRYDPATDVWIPTRRTNAPSAREGHTAIWTGTEMIVWGGIAGSFRMNTGGKYNPVTDSWIPTLTTSGVPASRAYHTAVWTGEEMIIWGGVGINGPLRNGGRIKPTGTWLPVGNGAGGIVPTPRWQHTAVWTGKDMIVWGGTDGEFYLATGERYDPDANIWKAMSLVAAPSPRGFHSAIWTGKDVIVWGGLDGTPLKTGGIYNALTNSWTPTKLEEETPSPRWGHTAVWAPPGRMIVWGGTDSEGPLDTGGIFSTLGNAWTATSTEADAPPARTMHTAVWTGSEMIVWGGETGSALVNTGGRYSPTSGTWVTSDGGNPVERTSHSTVWTGAEMIIWGGLGAGTTGELQSGARYDPSTNEWTPTSVDLAPIPRAGQSGVWTGSEMIVWGGHQGTTRLGTGGRYNPATDQWLQTSLGIGVPPARDNHGAIWTGTEMIVWGGFETSSILGRTGGRYDPAADLWTPTAVPEWPRGRFGHTTVWTGTEMIVWGGFVTGLVPSNAGGRYNPATDTWSGTSQGPDAPAPLTGHSAIWTGDRMIVWGGNDGASRLATGHFYDPLTDTWTPLGPGLGAPSGRSSHSALWTGSEMLVWGGQNESNVVLNSGGRYSPADDSWQMIDGSDAPTARSQHSAVLTGTQMIVWGGAQGSTPMNTGALYCYASPSSKNDDEIAAASPACP